MLVNIFESDYHCNGNVLELTEKEDRYIKIVEKNYILLNILSIFTHCIE